MIGSTWQYVKINIFLDNECFKYVKAHMSLNTFCGAAALVAAVSVVCILQAGNWGKGFYFN